MRTRCLIRAAAALAFAAMAASVFGATYTSPDASVTVTASTIELAQHKVAASGKAHITAIDKAAATRLEADAAGVQIVFLSAPGARPGIASVKNANLSGPVKMVYSSAKPGEDAVTITATADSASYDGITGIATLKGNVKIINDAPSRFAAPAVMTGDTASVNLNSDLGPDDFRFRLQSSPGTSKIEVTPKHREKTEQ